MKEIVLLVNFQDEDQRNAIKEILGLAEVLAREVDREEYTETVGALVGIKACSKQANPYRGKPFEKELMVFAGLSEEKFNRILAEMKKRQVKKVDYKAVMTPFNLTWTVEALYEEIAKEHREMSRRF